MVIDMHYIYSFIILGIRIKPIYVSIAPNEPRENNTKNRLQYIDEKLNPIDSFTLL